MRELFHSSRQMDRFDGCGLRGRRLFRVVGVMNG